MMRRRRKSRGGEGEGGRGGGEEGGEGGGEGGGEEGGKGGEVDVGGGSKYLIVKVQTIPELIAYPCLLNSFIGFILQ